jgi:hypothetical protein
MTIELIITIGSASLKNRYTALLAVLRLIICFTFVRASSTAFANEKPQLSFDISPVIGIGVDDQYRGSGEHDHLGVNRRDPSDIIRINGKYHVFYTKVVKYPAGKDGTLAPTWPEGYYGTIWYATSTDSKQWTEVKEVLGRGNPGAWDSFGVFTPNVIQGEDGAYYLYYTGVADGFTNNYTTNVTHIGVAKLVPNKFGGIAHCERLNDKKPILTPTYGQLDEQGKPKFDSYRVDDASLLMWDFDSDGQLEYGLYYKGRAQTKGAKETKMGLAVAESPSGPFLRQNHGNPVQPMGHEVLIWESGDGVMSLVSNAGRGLWYAKDGVHFEPLTDSFTGSIHAPGAFRPDLTAHSCKSGIKWGISMSNAGNCYLVRFAVRPDNTPLP